VEEALKLLRPSLPATVEIRTHFSPCPPVHADGTQLHQVLMNLALNSAHAMKEKGGRLEFGLDLVDVDAEAVRLSSQLRPGRVVRLTVSDTGKGMDAATVRRIFEPFFTTKGPGEGTGLGLSVVHGIVQQHNGIILVSSELGQGTTFQIYLPASGDAVVRRDNLPASTPLGHNENIIVVDDEELVVQVTTEILTRLGYRPRNFLDPSDVILALRQKNHDCALVITDLTMKRMTGIALAAEIRLIHPDIPILICTGFDGVLDVHDRERLALSGPLLKPFTMETLAIAVNQALSRA
jgi:CheY-like chemotaxis protein